MSATLTPKFLFSIDYVCWRDDCIFGWGWLFSRSKIVRHASLMLRYDDGATECIRLPYGSTRTDVAGSFPEVPHAAGSGFLLATRLRCKAHLETSHLLATFDDGSVEEVALPNFPAGYTVKTGSRAHWARRIRKALGEWRRIEFKQSIDFLRRNVRTRMARQRGHRINRAVKNTRKWHIVFDHALGGGANRYREQFVEQLNAEGVPVAVVLPDVATLTYAVHQRGAFGHDSQSYDSESNVLSALALRDIACITINNLVSYDEPEAMIAWVLKRKSEGVTVRVMLHDFFFVCPSFTLLDQNRKYCGVPELARCKDCLASNSTIFLSYIRDPDQTRWREAWWALLQMADEVVAFSASTLKIARRAYPSLDQCAIKIIPHIVDYLDGRTLSPDFNGSLVIGVVGHISVPKGAEIVREMVRIIDQERLDVRVVVIGSIDGALDSPSLKQTGRYDAADLLRILEEEKVTVGFLPSVIPETFSYVTSELIQMNLPLAVFDLGAPAERVRSYARGRVIATVDARKALQDIMDFHHALGGKLSDSSRSSEAMKVKFRSV